MGVPGESHALEIARRRGMPERDRRDAEAYLTDERTDVSELVKQLSERHRKLAEQEQDHRARETDLREKRRSDGPEGALPAPEGAGAAPARPARAARVRRDARGTSGRISRRPRASRARKRRDRSRASPTGCARGSSARRTGSSRSGSRLVPDDGFEPRPGMEVLVRGTGRRGRVVRKDRGRRWIVETETVRVSLGPGEMRPAPEDHRSVPRVGQLYALGSRAAFPRSSSTCAACASTRR